MPETAVYHMCRGELRRCLPTGWPCSSVSSITSTSTHCGVVAVGRRRYAEISRLKGAYPPLCEPAFRPLTNTSVLQSTAPKCSSTPPPSSPPSPPPSPSPPHTRHAAGSTKE